jgi:hypothetical protein
MKHWENCTMSTKITVQLSDGTTLTDTLANIKAKQAEIVQSLRGTQRDNLRDESRKAGDAAFETHMEAFWATVQPGQVLPDYLIAQARIDAGAAARIARQQVYLKAGRLPCPNFDTCGGLRQARFPICARCDGRA